MPLDPQLADLLDLIASAPPPESMDPGAAREMMRNSVSFLAPEPVEVGAVSDLVVEGVPCRLYRPEGEGPVPTVVFLHGGGFVLGDLVSYDPVARRLCRDTGAAVLSVDYRLAPEHPFPAGVTDAVSVARWAAEHTDELGGSPVLAVAGDSAGGTLGAVVAQELGERLTAQLLVYPSVDKRRVEYPSRGENGRGLGLDLSTMAWFTQLYLGGTDAADEDPRLSPIAGDLTGLAPALVVTAEFDPLRDEGERYADALREAGNRVELLRCDGMIHGFFTFAALSTAADGFVAETYRRFAAMLR